MSEQVPSLALPSPTISLEGCLLLSGTLTLLSVGAAAPREASPLPNLSPGPGIPPPPALTFWATDTSCQLPDLVSTIMRLRNPSAGPRGLWGGGGRGRQRREGPSHLHQPQWTTHCALARLQSLDSAGCRAGPGDPCLEPPSPLWGERDVATKHEQPRCCEAGACPPAARPLFRPGSLLASPSSQDC